MKLLAVIDMQNDFIDGALGTKEAVAIVEHVKARIAKAKADGEAVIFTRDTHFANYMDTQEGKKLPVPHCIENTFGWEVREGLAEADDVIIDKPTFGSTELQQHVVEMGYTDVELIGLCTDICVISNAMLIKAALPECNVSVRADCCAGVTPESHQNALAAMAMCQIDIL